MIQKRTFIRTALLLGRASPLLLTGCGLKGPLYLPKKRSVPNGAGDSIPVLNTPIEKKDTDGGSASNASDSTETRITLTPGGSQAAEAPSPKR